MEQTKYPLPLKMRPKREIKRHLPKRFVEVSDADIEAAINDCTVYAALGQKQSDAWFYAWVALESSLKSLELHTAAYPPQWAFDYILMRLDNWDDDMQTGMLDTINTIVTSNYMRSRDLPNLEYNWAIQDYLLDVCVEIDFLLEKSS